MSRRAAAPCAGTNHCCHSFPLPCHKTSCLLPRCKQPRNGTIPALHCAHTRTGSVVAPRTSQPTGPSSRGALVVVSSISAAGRGDGGSNRWVWLCVAVVQTGARCSVHTHASTRKTSLCAKSTHIAASEPPKDRRIIGCGCRFVCK